MEPSASPSASAARSVELTAAPTPMATLLDDSGFLGPGCMSGFFSADGISGAVLLSLGEEGVTRQVHIIVLLNAVVVRPSRSVYRW